jgi:hypothetical protein
MGKRATTCHLRSRRQSRRLQGGTWSVALCGLFTALTTGCKQEVGCPALDSCGGPQPIGNWVLAPGYPSCTEDLYVPATDTRLAMGDVPPSGKPLPEPALFDWCLLLVTGPSSTSNNGTIQIRPPRFYYESGPIGAVSVRYEADGHFATGITRTGTYTLDFPGFCVRAFGTMDGAPIDPVNDPMGPTGGVCKQLEGPVRVSGISEGSYQNTICDANPDDPEGCLCTFDVTETGGPGGVYQMVNSNTILHLAERSFPAKATFCNQGDRLELTGTDGTYLFDQRGLRTLDLVRAP